jgi:hypothetical protein
MQKVYQETQSSEARSIQVALTRVVIDLFFATIIKMVVIS